MSRLFLALVVVISFLGTPNSALGQKFIGPEKAKPQQLVTLELDSPLGDDPKFQIVPKSNAFRVLKDFDGKPVIVFVPSEDDAGKTFLVVYAATTKEKNEKDEKPKTLLATHTIEISGGTPKPNPTPSPEPTPKNVYLDRLKASYLVNPDAQKLDKLLFILKEVKESDFTTPKEAASVLKSVTQKYLPEWSDLRLTRDEIQKIIEEEYGTSNAVPLDKKKFKTTLEGVIGALQLLKNQ